MFLKSRKIRIVTHDKAAVNNELLVGFNVP